MHNIERPSGSVQKLLDLLKLYNARLDSSANIARGQEKAVGAVSRIGKVRLRQRASIREAVDDMLRDESEALRTARNSQQATDLNMAKEIQQLARECGLQVMSKAKKAGDPESLRLRIQIADKDLFREAIESAEVSKEDLLKLAEGFKEDIFSGNWERLMSSKSLQGLDIIADQENVQDDPFFTRAKHIIKALAKSIHEKDGENLVEQNLKKIAAQLFLEFEKDMGDKLRVIPTGDASREYLLEADITMNLWLKKAKWMYQNPEYALYATQMNTTYKNALKQYLQAHEQPCFGEEECFGEAKAFALERAYEKTERM
ncbi:MAG: hypothetical protein AAB551_01835 [Patescibacteria group bacterium]